MAKVSDSCGASSRWPSQLSWYVWSSGCGSGLRKAVSSYDGHGVSEIGFDVGLVRVTV